MMMMSTAAGGGGGEGEGVRININNGGGRFPFTASQWEELEHQALVYKYIISGIPIPPHLLLFTIKTTSSSSTSTNTNHHHPPIGWKSSCFEMGGFGRKIDPEPGRCRRTDGKKWRCSKEAYPDSKYCERHMHRGRNRSRKPVEVVNNISTPIPNSHPLSSSSSSDYYNSSSYSPNVLSSHQDHLLLNSSPYRKSYYYNNGMKPFFSGTSMGDDSWQLAMNNSSSKQTDYHQNRYSYQPQDEDQVIDRKEEAGQKVMHHFIDEWPVSNENENDDNNTTTTRLSISIPTATCARDFFLPHK